MTNVTYNNISEMLLERFPEYKKSTKYYKDTNKNLPHVLLANLSLMIFDNIDQNDSLDLACRLVTMADEVINNPSTDGEVINLFQVEMFEQLVGSRKGAILAKELLHSKSLDLLEQTLKHFGTTEFAEEYKK